MSGYLFVRPLSICLFLEADNFFRNSLDGQGSPRWLNRTLIMAKKVFMKLAEVSICERMATI